MDALDHEDLAFEFDLASSVPHQTGGVDSSGRQSAGERARQSATGCADHMVEGRRTRREVVGAHPVMVGYCAVNSVDDRLFLSGQEGLSDRSVPPLDTHL